MDAAEITTLISNIGFPIACVIAMFAMWNKEREDHKTEIKELTADHKLEVAQMTEAVNNNTTVLEKILTKLGVQ